MAFKALLATKTDGTISTTVTCLDEKDLKSGDVSIVVDYSTVNYKDALAISGRLDVIQEFPLIPGIDLAGTVEASSHPGIAVGDRVVANSWGLSQTHHGGYAQKARLNGDWLVKIPERQSNKDAMAIGTAGYTGMLSVLALEHGGLTPERGDPRNRCQRWCRLHCNRASFQSRLSRRCVDRPARGSQLSEGAGRSRHH